MQIEYQYVSFLFVYMLDREYIVDHINVFTYWN